MGNEAMDTQLPYDLRVTGYRSQLLPVLNVALSGWGGGMGGGVLRGRLNINGHVATSALGSGHACSPAAVIAHCPLCSLPAHSGPLMSSGLFPSLNGLGCDRWDSTGSGVHSGQRSLLFSVLSGWPHSASQVRRSAVLRLKTPPLGLGWVPQHTYLKMTLMTR